MYQVYEYTGTGTRIVHVTQNYWYAVQYAVCPAPSTVRLRAQGHLWTRKAHSYQNDSYKSHLVLFGRISVNNYTVLVQYRLPLSYNALQVDRPSV